MYKFKGCQHIYIDLFYFSVLLISYHLSIIFYTSTLV
jgi:hypothetical protein